MKRVGVVTFPGSNCDADFRRAIGRVPGLAAVALWHKDEDLDGIDAVILPGGFSYGDYLRCGAIARFSPMMRSVRRFAEAGGPVLGVCNGFQILCEAGLLPGTLLRNAGISFLCKDVFVCVEGRRTPFTGRARVSPEVGRPGRHLEEPPPPPLRLPIAHGEGCWYADAETLARVERAGQIVFRYCDARGLRAEGCNPNGSVADVAGVCNEAGNVVGLMPHPERAVGTELGGTDGLVFLHGLADHLGVPEEVRA